MSQLDYIWSSIGTPLGDVWGGVLIFLPKLIIALLVFLIGWLIAVLVARVVWQIIKVLKVDRALESLGFKKVWERSGFKLDAPMFFYQLVKWFFIIVFLMAATDILGLSGLTLFLQDVLNYLPNVFVAALILVAGVLVARFLEGLIQASVKAAQLGLGVILAKVAKWAVLIFAILTALQKLGVADSLVATAETGIIFAAALAFGLAFGLGGRDQAKEVVSRIAQHFEK